MENKVLTGLLLVLIGGWGSLSAQSAGNNYSRQVNTLIGTEGVGLTSGYLHLGAIYPYGMVQFTPSYFSKRSGFVINQLDDGDCEHMDNFPTFPVKGKLKMFPDNILNYRINISEEKGYAGYYEAMVQEDIKAKLTITERADMTSYEYPADQQYDTVIIGGGISVTPIEQVAIVITAPNKCEGYAESGNFCGLRTSYKVYSVAESDTDTLESGTWKRNELEPSTAFAEGEYSGVYFTFDVNKRKNIQYKIGVSYAPVENTREDLETEDTGQDFLQIQNQAESKWNHYLGKIEVEGTSPGRTTQFYTHLYRSFTYPNVYSDVNEEHMGTDFKVHKSRSKHYTSFSNWDTYRTQIQLSSILGPEVTSDIVISYQSFAEETDGAFLCWVMANIKTGVMQGDSTPILISNVYAFGARNYDPKPIFRTMRKGAEEPGAMSQEVETRPGLKQYLGKGYYNASIQLEYIPADFAIAQFTLHAVGNEFASQRYFHFTRSWKNLYNPETGWLQPRNPDGSWKPPTEDFRESTHKNYFRMVPYGIAGLIEIIGGKVAAEKRLDEFFTRLNTGYNDIWFAPGNEPSFHIPWIYNWVGTPYKIQEIINRALNEQYSSKIDGLPGNGDLGTMGAWYVFACIGLYPEIPGVGGLTMNTPIFSSVKVHLKKGDMVIKGGSEENIYTRSMKLNGRPYDSTWIDWDRLNNGATIGYTTSSKPDMKWGTKVTPSSFP